MAKRHARLWVAICICVSAATAGGQSLTAPLFPDPEFHADFHPHTLRACDFDHDGAMDWVASGVQTIVGFGDGRGGVRAAAQYDTSSDWESIAIGDLDANGWEDVVVASRYARRVDVLLATGHGAFALLPSLQLAGEPAAMALGDLDGDQDLDLVIVGTSPGGVDVLLGDGLGAFAWSSHWSAGFMPIAVALADVDGDGRLDALVANNQSADLTILHGDGSGGFVASNGIQLNGRPNELAVGDFNGDAHVDVAIADGWASSVEVLLGTGNGGFFAPILYACAFDPNDVTATDFDGDGVLDVIAVGTQGVTLLHGSGNGTFASAASYALAEHSYSLACADFDGDGNCDIVLADGPRGAVTYAFGDGSGGLALAPRYAAGSEPLALASGDFDGDGALDVAVASRWQNEITWLRGDGHGALGAAVSFGPANSWPMNLAAADLDGDGDVDLGCIDWASMNIESWLDDGHGNFTLAYITNLGLQTPFGAAAADFDGDGALDWVVARQFSGSVSLYTNNGAGSFAWAGDFAIPGEPRVPTVGDFDGDGRPDLAVLSVNLDVIDVLLNDGQGGFRMPPSIIALPSSVWFGTLAAGDLDGDGFDDLVGAGQPDSTSVCWMSAGATGFGPPVIQSSTPLSASARVATLAIRDVDDDGRADLVGTVADQALVFNNLFVRLGDGSGRLGPPRWQRAGTLPASLEPCDLDGDHRIDLVVGNSYSADISVFRSRLPPVVESYCTSGTSTHGCVAELTASGLARVGATSGFVLAADHVEGLRNAMMFYGATSAIALPWAAGSTSYLCVQPPVERMAVQNSGGTLFQCDGALAQDWSAFAAAHPSALGAPFGAGTRLWAQVWYRDPAAPRTSNLSNGVMFTLVP